jgi:ComF family protein
MRSLLHLLAPPLCAGCGASAGALEPLCAACRTELRWLAPEPVPIAAPPCDADPRSPPGALADVAAVAPLLAWAPLAYEGAARGVVRALKFKGAARAAGAMAAQIAATAPPGWLTPPAELVPVPLHPARARKRGYNQAERLAAALASRTGLALRSCLARTGPRGTQVGRNRAQRLAGIAGSIHVAGPPPERAVLVDDVITTGATLAACADALRRHGAREVVAVTYTRTPGR